MTLRTLTPQQWKSGLAAWLGWLFDGLDMHLYTVVAPVFVALLLGGIAPTDPLVKEKSAWIQAAFLVGWALGGAFFGRVGDLLGRSRALSLTILTYALFTGLSSFAQTWWQLLLFRFVAALGIGGEWAVGSALLSETWPRSWRGWIAAVLQTGVNIGVLLATLTTYLMAGQERWVFVVGILPALLVFWIRKNVPEPDEWHAARSVTEAPPLTALFRPPTLSVTLRTIAVCGASLTGWWAFQFWNLQYVRSLTEVVALEKAAVTQLASRLFASIIGLSILGNFFAGWLARRFGYRVAIALMLLGFALADLVAFALPRPLGQLLYLLPIVGFFSGVFALFTMYLPPLFPTLLRTSGAGFCYNIGRIVAATGTVIFFYAPVPDMRYALLGLSGLFALALLFALLLPDLRDDAGKVSGGAE